MSGAVRAALKSTTSVCALVQRSHGLLPMRCFSTEAEQPPLNSTPRPPPFFETDHSGLTYGNLLGVRKHALKTDIINFLEGCNLTLEDVKMDYDRSYSLVSTLLQFPSRDSFDNAVRVILRKGRLYKLDRVNRHIWDQVKPYDGKTILIQGMPRAGTYEDIGRILSGFEFDSSSVNVFLRPGGVAGADPIKLATVRFNSRTQAMNAYIAKNGTFCQNNRIWIQVIQ
ncbi:hypothetical protein AAZX31_05G074600 [Glycine max]|uniref:Uncharacterized protein n=2 Tax=Glycine subgen. Soja TaxID=1462606 RepID=K7KP00_SOYBN|nr:uncharacterized protein LOC100775478 [Glycine max]XP_028231943.1 uncharacterized protein LOC114412313 [Glycine soja]KAG5028537.1 hypothetical protein JHK87_012051 [Glycine soja]KAG5040002.1 hypothetical protein JHK85_012478 [Glycine max]KAG5057152.1 hypothetical protein JHK86_012148 [Glycine max]KAG5154181.1 hypothetical protein JHK82_012150 [Glycine max]KAH1133294.1 hypothetical protein GYH30_011929 [Glycine max]|eukprot:XP_014631019.1 uncharacterized protein LOC100775478 [Glycine max]